MDFHIYEEKENTGQVRMVGGHVATPALNRVGKVFNTNPLNAQPRRALGNFNFNTPAAPRMALKSGSLSGTPMSMKKPGFQKPPAKPVSRKKPTKSKQVVRAAPPISLEDLMKEEVDTMTRLAPPDEESWTHVHPEDERPDRFIEAFKNYIPSNLLPHRGPRGTAWDDESCVLSLSDTDDATPTTNRLWGSADSDDDVPLMEDELDVLKLPPLETILAELSVS